MNDDETLTVASDQGVTDPDADITENGSLLGALREQAKAVASDTTTDIDIPGYGGVLFARYHALDSQELDDIRRKVRAETKNRSDQVTYAALDTLILACEEFWVRSETEGVIPFRKVRGVDSELPVKYDQVLAEKLSFELPNPPTARSVVIELFGGNVLAAQAHSALVSQWMLRIDLGVSQDMGGI